MKVELRGHGARISLLIDDHQASEGNDESGERWLTCRVDVSAGSFTAQYDAAFQTEDFDTFAEELSEAVRAIGGVASLRPLEEALTLEVSVTRNGKATIKGRVTVHDLGRSEGAAFCWKWASTDAVR